MDSRRQLEEIAEAKKQERVRRAKLPFPEKIRAIVRMQKRRAPLVRLRGKEQRIWPDD